MCALHTKARRTRHCVTSLHRCRLGKTEKLTEIAPVSASCRACAGCFQWTTLFLPPHPSPPTPPSLCPPLPPPNPPPSPLHLSLLVSICSVFEHGSSRVLSVFLSVKLKWTVFCFLFVFVFIIYYYYYSVRAFTPPPPLLCPPSPCHHHPSVQYSFPI